MFSVQQQPSPADGAFQRYNLSDSADNGSWWMDSGLLIPAVDEYLLVCLFVCSLIVTVVLIWILIRSYSSTTTRLQSGHFCMLINLSVSDLGFLCTAVPASLIYHSATYNLFNESYGNAVCSVVHYVIYVTCYVSMYTMVVTTIFLLCTELIGQWTLLSRFSASVSCVVIWIGFLIANVSTLIHPPSPEFLACSITNDYVDEPLDEPSGRRTWITFLVFAFLLPLTIISILSAVILQCQRNREMSVTGNLTPLPTAQQSGKTLTRQHQQQQPYQQPQQPQLKHSLEKKRGPPHHLQPATMLVSSSRQLQTPSPASNVSAVADQRYRGGDMADLPRQFVYRNENLCDSFSDPAVDHRANERRCYASSSVCHRGPVPQQFVRQIGFAVDPTSGGGLNEAEMCPLTADLLHLNRNGSDVVFHREYFGEDMPSASMQNSPVCELMMNGCNAAVATGELKSTLSCSSPVDGDCHHCGHSLECHWNKSRSTDDSCSGTDAEVTIISMQPLPLNTYSKPRVQWSGNHSNQQLQTANEKTALFHQPDSGSSPVGLRSYTMHPSSLLTGVGGSRIGNDPFSHYDNARLKSQTTTLPPLPYKFDEDFDEVPQMPELTNIVDKRLEQLRSIDQQPTSSTRYACGNPRLQQSSPPPPLPPPRNEMYVTFNGCNDTKAAIASSASASTTGGQSSHNLAAPLKHQMASSSTTLCRKKQAAYSSDYHPQLSNQQQTSSTLSSNYSHHHQGVIPATAEPIKMCNGNCSSRKTLQRISDTLTLSTATTVDSDVTAAAAATARCVCCSFARQPASEDHFRRHKEMTILIMATAVARTLCWFPFQIFVISAVYNLALSHSIYYSFGTFAVCLVFISPCFSPLIYYASSLDFRRLCNVLLFSSPSSTTENAKYMAKVNGGSGVAANL